MGTTVGTDKRLPHGWSLPTETAFELLHETAGVCRRAVTTSVYVPKHICQIRSTSMISVRDDHITRIDRKPAMKRGRSSGRCLVQESGVTSLSHQREDAHWYQVFNAWSARRPRIRAELQGTKHCTVAA